MAVDEVLAERFRNGLVRCGDFSGRLEEKRMMGGLCFMLDGAMLGGVDRTKDGMRRFMFRVGKENEAKAVKFSGAEPMIQGGRRMGGLFFVQEQHCGEDALVDWLSLAIGFVETLPPKKAKK